MSNSTSKSHSADHVQRYTPPEIISFTGGGNPRNSNTKEKAMTPKKPTGPPPPQQYPPPTHKFYMPTQTPPN